MKRAGVDTRSALKKQLSAQAAMQAELERLRAENAELRAENAELRAAHRSPRSIQWADEPGADQPPTASSASKAKRLERLRSYDPGEYSEVLESSSSAGTDHSVSFAIEEDDEGGQPERRRRLQSFSIGEYSEILGSEASPGGAGADVSKVSFAADAQPEDAPAARRNRLMSYSKGEYSGVMDTSSAEQSVSFADAGGPEAVRRNRLMSYSKGEYSGVIDSSATAAADQSVSFAEGSDSAPPRRVQRLMSYDPGQYKGTLKAEQQAEAKKRSGKHLWGVARGTMAMAVGLPMAVAKPIAEFDPAVAVAEAVLVEPPAETAAMDTSSDSEPELYQRLLAQEREEMDAQQQRAAAGALTRESSAQLLAQEEAEHQAELARIGSGALPPAVAAAPVSSSPTAMSDWPTDLSDVHAPAPFPDPPP